MGFLALLLALAKAFPAFANLVEATAAELRRQRLTATHHEIDAACDTAQAAPWVCPAACPRAVQLRQPGSADATVPKTP